MTRIRYSFVFAFALASLFAFENFPANVDDEICDNALDDDLDGLIDLNDPDCDCPSAEPLSLIPNPSFEERTCCPVDRSQLYCAIDWIQASEATTDYLHTCGWTGWDNLPVPLPFPEGEGCVGWRNGRPSNSNSGAVPNWKEYAGACLTGPLQAGKTYRFEFYVGFTTQPNSPGTTIVFFGSTNCGNLPFGIGDPNFGCPTNGPGWMELGSVPINGTFEWQLKQIIVTPTVDITAIAIGPNCTPNNTTFQPYYFFDNLVLATQEAFDFRITPTAHPCSQDFGLSTALRDTLSYQWYKDGIALIGETGNTLTDVPGEGNYQVRLLGPSSCFITEIYAFDVPAYPGFVSQTICEGQSFPFNQQEFTDTGIYTDTVKNAQNCDSIIFLDLQVLPALADTVRATIFEGETWKMAGHTFSSPGNHTLLFTSSLGCDSNVLLILDFYKVFIPNVFSPNQDGFNDYFTVFSGKDAGHILSMEVFDRWGGKVFSASNISPNEQLSGWDGMVDGRPAAPGQYAYKIILSLAEDRQKEFTGGILVVK